MADFCTSCGAPYDEGDRFCGKCGTPRSGDDAPAAEARPQPAPTTPPSQSQNAKVGRVILMVIGLTLVPVFLMFGMGDCGSSEGHMAVSNSPHGDWDFVTTGCASMQPFGAMGANLHADGHNDGAVYVTLAPPNGHRVEIEVPGSCQNADGTDCTVFEVPREQCSTYDVHVEPTGTVVNDIRLVEGHVHLECSLADGTQVAGRIDFDGC